MKRSSNPFNTKDSLTSVASLSIFGRILIRTTLLVTLILHRAEKQTRVPGLIGIGILI